MEEQEFQYNDEFFFDPLMRERAERDFSAIWFALYSEKISKEFREHDETAKRLKREFQTWGFRVVGFAVLALSIAALEPTFLPQVVDAGYLPDISGEIVATIAALAGVTSIAMGFFGMGFSSRKTHWLEVRLLCERIRQWRWQYFCAHSLEALAASSNLQLQEEYTSGRDKYFSDFIEGLKKDAQRA